jgi:hypothetical protein
MNEGNMKARWILIQAANAATRKDYRHRKFYLGIAKKDMDITRL